jgi:hypothetical protein
LKTPDEVYNGSAANCKGKAVALYERMRSQGAENVRLVIGKRTASAVEPIHGWNGKLPTAPNILDSTINWSAFNSAQTGNKSYLPLYAYSGTRKYRAADVTLYAQN